MAETLVDLAAYLDPARVVFIDGSPPKRDALLLVSEAITARFAPKERTAFLKAIFDREDVTSTGIGNGIAIPHARLPSLAGCMIAVAICPGGIDFGARDGKPVRLVVMIAACDRDRAEHLRVLASVAARLTDERLRERLVATTDPGAVVEAMAQG